MTCADNAVEVNASSNFLEVAKEVALKLKTEISELYINDSYDYFDVKGIEKLTIIFTSGAIITCSVPGTIITESYTKEN